VISLVATLGTGVFAGLMVWELTKHRAASLLGGLLVFAFPYTHEWGILCRVDMTAIFLTVVGLWWAIRFRESRWVYLAVLWLLPAGFTRHSLIAAPAAVCLGLFAARRRRGILFAAILVASAALVFLVIDLASGHEFFVNVIRGNSAAVKLTGGFSHWTKRFFRGYAATSVLALVCAAAGMRRRLISKARRKSAVSCALALAIAVQCFGVAWFKDIYPSPIDPAKREREDRVIEALREIPGPVIAQDVSFAIFAGKPMIYQPLVMTQLSREGLWDQGPFVQQIRDGAFAAILMDEPLDRHKPGYLFTGEQLDAMRQRYHLKRFWPSNPEGTRGKFLYVPNVDAAIPERGIPE
jgi:hypothetical protein